MAWCPWCQPDPKDGTENRICERHLAAMLREEERRPMKQPTVKPFARCVCRACGFVNPSHARHLHKKVDV